MIAQTAPSPPVPPRGTPWRIDVPWPYLLAILFAVLAIWLAAPAVVSRFPAKIAHIANAAAELAMLAMMLGILRLAPPAGKLAPKLGIRRLRFADLGSVCAGLAAAYLWLLATTPLWENLLRSRNIVWKPQQELLTECASGSFGNYLALLALAGVLIPTAEEILFRRVVFGALFPVGRIAATLLTAVVFATAHLFLHGFPALLGLGIVFQLQYLFTDNLLVPVLTHMIFNAVSLTLVFCMGQ